MRLNRREFIALSAVAAVTPTHTVFATQGPALPLTEHHGKVLMVDFWASWCIPCKRSFPWLNEVSNTYKEQGLVVLGVNVDESKSAAQAFLANTPANFDILYDPQGTLATEYDLKAMPSSLIFDRTGQLIAHHHGFKSKLTHEYEAIIESVL